MSQNSLPPEWLELLVDPYAVLGISLNSEEGQILKRYYTLAKQLHPDNHNRTQAKELAESILCHLVNPAYEQVKYMTKRLYTLEMLRLKTNSLKKEDFYSDDNPLLEQMETMSAQEGKLFYEEAIASYADAQYKSLEQSYHVTRQIRNLNVVYQLFIKAQRQSQKESSGTVLQVSAVRAGETANFQQSTETTYAQRHYERAVQYANQSQWALAVQELREAIKLDPSKSDYYALLGVVHCQQKLIGMAKVYIRQALKLNPKQPVALRYAARLNMNPTENANPPSVGKAMSIAALLNKFLSRPLF
ncbi:DnaJ domain-containing protein [Cronbergia sp. UHCC 0137]|uniref:DnaJ domain-containing protein n=1 Tax=Cronbergia sp. UHCC 0137 TaxID=3110239 RepID=UPI002B21EE79|nr:DnaJ domain-containing protein [Cronbergia sp. UHCC 0137]MEA5617739.1 DnaJ domain-containing protein [Cronbergia sp. UHCC 0137]